jgi:DNA-binding transcriptional LysR family regulator
METVSARFEQAATFAEVVAAGSFTRAAQRLRLSKAQVSKRVAELEAALGLRLLHRTTRRLALTDAGRLYLDYARTLGDTLDEAERAVSALRSEVAGRLRLTAPMAFGDAVLVDAMLEFQRMHPGVEVELDLSIQRRDLIADGYDLALRQARTLEPSLVARPLGVLRDLPVASPAVVAAHGPIDAPDDLARVPCVINSHFPDDPHWLFERDGETTSVSVRGPMRTNHFAGIKRAAMAGAGIARLPHFLVARELEDGTLVRVCEGWSLVSTPLYLVYPDRRHQPLRVRAFIDFLMQWMAEPARAALFR